MKKVISIALSLLLAVSLSACGGTAEPVSAGNENRNIGTTAAKSSDAPESAVEFAGDIGGEITVSAYDTMKSKAFLEDAARLFEEKYPGTKVNVETFSAMPEVKTSEQGNMKLQAVQVQDDPQGRQDYINRVNTSIMSGQGADVLSMDVLPSYKYADSGQLENLSDYMAADTDFNRADYRANILDAVEYKGGTWFIPLDYTFDYYAYDSTLLTGNVASGFGTGSAYNVGGLMEIAEPFYDGSNGIFNSVDYAGGPRGGAGGMWSNLLNENYASFVDIENKSAHFDDGRFAALLESVKEYSEKGYIQKGVTGERDAGAIMRRAGEVPTERFFFKDKNIFTLTNHFTRNIGMRMNVMIGGAGAMANEEDDEIAGIAADANGSVPFDFEQAYGINANSKNKETAWEFIKFLLSEEMQLNANMMITALPLHNSARDKKAETVMTGMSGKQGQEMSEDQKKTIVEALGGYNETVEKLSDQINSFVFTDSVVNDMISSEVRYFFEGNKTAEEVANVLQSKVDLYLNE